MSDLPSEFDRAQEEFLALVANLKEKMEGFEPPYCNFCGRGKSQVGAMVQGLNGFICDTCAYEVQRLIRLGG